MSTSFGPRGLHYTVGHRRRRATIGLPGSGLSYTTYSSTHARTAAAAAGQARGGSGRGSAPALGGGGRGGAPGAGVVTQTQASTRTGETSRGARPPAAGAAAAAAGGQSAWAQLAALTPPRKIAWGVLLTLAVITAPVGLWLLVAGLWQLHLPEWRVRTYVHQAALEPANAEQLLAQAQAINPHSPEVLAPLAELRAAQGRDAEALALYREYCVRVPGDWLARGHLAVTALRCNQLDEAIRELVAIRHGAPATGDSMASITAHLAYAYLSEEDPQQALALIDNGWANVARNGPGGEQCLYYHAVCRYMLGNTDAALRDLDTLYAVNPEYVGVQAAKDAMRAEEFELLLADGTALVPVTPGHWTRAAVKVQKTAPRSPHCLNCQAPLGAAAATCAYCHAAVGGPGTTAGTTAPGPGGSLDDMAHARGGSAGPAHGVAAEGLLWPPSRVPDQTAYPPPPPPPPPPPGNDRGGAGAGGAGQGPAKA